MDGGAITVLLCLMLLLDSAIDGASMLNWRKLLIFVATIVGVTVFKEDLE